MLQSQMHLFDMDRFHGEIQIKSQTIILIGGEKWKSI
jgi:hypothetical protein